MATEVAREAARQNRINALSWEERGPNADAVVRAMETQGRTEALQQDVSVH